MMSGKENDDQLQDQKFESEIETNPSLKEKEFNQNNSEIESTLIESTPKPFVVTESPLKPSPEPFVVTEAEPESTFLEALVATKVLPLEEEKLSTIDEINEIPKVSLESTLIESALDEPTRDDESTREKHLELDGQKPTTHDHKRPNTFNNSDKPKKKFLNLPFRSPLVNSNTMHQNESATPIQAAPASIIQRKTLIGKGKPKPFKTPLIASSKSLLPTPLSSTKDKKLEEIKEELRVFKLCLLQQEKAHEVVCLTKKWQKVSRDALEYLRELIGQGTHISRTLFHTLFRKW